MQVKYKILEVNESEHSIIVRYFTDRLDEDFLAVDRFSGNIQRREDGSPVNCRTDYNINVFETPSTNTDVILEIIDRNAPVHWLHMQEQVLDQNVDTDLVSAKTLLGEVGTLDKSLDPVNFDTLNAG